MTSGTTLGTLLLGTNLFQTNSLVNGRLAYNGFSLDDGDFRLATLTDLFDQGLYTFTQYESIRNDGRIYGSFNQETKTITARGIINGDSEDDLEDNINMLKGYLLQPNKTLQYVTADGTILHTTATVTGLQFPREHYHVTFCPFIVTFETLEPCFYGDTINQTARTGVNSNISGGATNTTGCYKAEPRVIISFLTGLSAVTTIDVTIGDNTISITGSFTNGDNVMVDTKERTVSKNGTEIYTYTGSFPVVEYGDNQVDIEIDGTWTADIYLVFYPTYA